MTRRPGPPDPDLWPDYEKNRKKDAKRVEQGKMSAFVQGYQELRKAGYKGADARWGYAPGTSMARAMGPEEFLCTACGLLRVTALRSSIRRDVCRECDDQTPD